MASSRTVLITGGNRGLGQALVHRFASEGWTVLATARQVESLDTAVLKPGHGYALDLASHDSVVQLSTALVERCTLDQTQIDCIIHNAGFNPKDVAHRPGYFESTFYCNESFSAANVAESMLINALHPMELTGRLAPILAPTAVVLAISSWIGSIGEKTVPGHYGYAGSKALLNMCIKGLSLEYAKDTGGRVALAINPGWMQTAMGGGDKADISPDDVAQRIHSLVDNESFLKDHNGAFINIIDLSPHAY